MKSPWDVKLCLEESAGNSFHDKLSNQLVKEIQSGRLKPGSSMPSSRQLAAELGVNRKTVQLVYEELESQGWLFTRSRRGTFIADVLPEQGLSTQTAALLQTTDEARSASPLMTELYHSAVDEQKGIIGANDGVPDPRLVPYEVLSKAYRRAIIQLTRMGELGYGDPRGLVELRQAIQEMLSLERFMSLDLEQICVVRGSQMGIYLAARVLDPEKGAIVCEELSYPPAIAAFEANGFKVIRCRLDEKGLDTAHLKTIIEQQKVAAVYTTPHHQYPTTVSMSMERRLMLLALSNQHSFWVIEDDYDHEFHYGTKPIPPLASLPASQNVVHIGSMSKVFAPALRLGYIAADKRFIDLAAQEILLIDRQGNGITELALAFMMASGEVKKHIRKMRRHYQARRDFAISMFDKLLGDELVIQTPAGGLALWVDLHKVLCQKQVEEFEHPDFDFERLFGNKSNPSTHLRFGFGALNEEEMTRSIQQLAELLSL